MKIVVDCRVFTKRATGVATYAIDAIRAICQYIPDWHLTLVSPVPFHKSIVGLPLDKVDVIIKPMPFGLKLPKILWFHFCFSKVVKDLKADIVWSPIPETPLLSVGNAKRMITVHDVVNKEYRETMLWKDKLASFFIADYAIRKSDLIWCNSYYTRDKVNQYYINRKQINMVIGDSCSTIFRKVNIDEATKDEILHEYGLEDRFLLFVGTLEPRKNLSFLLKIMPEIYQKTGCKLLVVGASGWKNSDIAHIINASDYPSKIVIFANYIDIEKLVCLYNLATLYVSTALNEGFGMPQLEAMACGCPVVSPHNSAMIEVVEGRGVTIEGKDEKVWINTIANLLQDSFKLNQMKNPDLSEFDWKRIILNVKQYVINNM